MSSTLPCPDLAFRSASRARLSAASKEVLVRPKSFPMARDQTAPRLRGAMPRHHISRVRRSRIATFQRGRMSCSQICIMLSAATSRHSERARLAAWRRFSASRLCAIIFWYSFRWRRSSAGSLGGSHDGRVRERTASFSLEMGRGSIMMFDRRRGGSSAMADLTLGLTSGSDDLLFGMEPVLDRCCILCSRCSACSSSFSVRDLASAFKSASAADQLLALDMTGLETRLEAAELIVERADSDFHVGDRSDPCATAIAGVPFPTLRTRSLGCRSGDGALDGGRL